MKKPSLLFCLLLLACSQLYAQFPSILPLQQRAAVQDRWLEERIRTLLPNLMRREGIDMWIIAAREYNEDPVIKTMLPATWMAARRRTVLLVFDPGREGELETLAVARYNIGKSFEKAWDPERQSNQWARVAELVQERLVSAERLTVGWLETRTASEMQVYPQIVRIAHKIIAEGFSEEVIQPGVTTTDEVVWWFRERVAGLKLDAWFHPTVSLQRADPESFDHLRSFSNRPEREVIRPGDLLHVDFGITYLGLNTDTQQHAYVLKAGETDAPQALKDAFVKGNRLQDILTDAFVSGHSGNEILKNALAQAEREGIKATIYTHPIGYHGHAAGPTIGLWDQQGGVPGAGDYPLYQNTAYSIELNAAVMIPEWEKEVRIMLEEDAYFDGEKVYYIDGRQEKLLLIPRAQANAR